MNGYSKQGAARECDLSVVSVRLEQQQQEEKLRFFCLSYIHGVTDRTGKLPKKAKVQILFKPSNEGTAEFKIGEI